MKTNIFIPEKINVGFQNRNDTYTKKLAYVIYYDHKGVLRKQASWDGWRNKEIENIIYENIPTSGFVLNKKVGGYSNGWDHRQTYCRIYDPRGFEFEINIPNLLFILENTNSIKGKGLDGDFVYGWDGKDIILIPTSSPDYIEISQFNKILHDKSYVKSKDLIIGATYKSKDNTELIYMGRFDLCDTKTERVLDVTKGTYGNNYKYIKNNINKGKHYFFSKASNSAQSISLLTFKSLGDKLIETVSNECVENYADLFGLLERRTEYSHYDKSKDEWVHFTLEEFKEFIDGKDLDRNSWSRNFSIKTSSTDSVDIRYDYEIKEFYTNGGWMQQERKYVINAIGDVEQLFNKYHPVYKNEYLENGKLCRRIE